MTLHHSRPRLRWPIDLRLEQLEKQSVLIVNCPLGIAPTPLLLVPAVAPIISCFDGSRLIEEIQQQFSQYGVQLKLIEELVQLLDRHLFLAGPTFDAAERQTREHFAKSTVRPAALAGSGYSALRAELTKDIDNYINGYAPTRKAGASAMFEGPMISLVSPHIDYRRGGDCYGRTYAHLIPETHDLYILIGTAHQFSSLLFHLTLKDFASPFGNLPCDRPFVQDLAKKYGEVKSFTDEPLHRREHSLELQLPFLGRLKNTPQIVPILVGSFHRMISSGKLPNELDEYESFAGALAETIGARLKSGQRVCFIAGVDMSHVGRFFGDTDKLTPEFMEQVGRRDKEYLTTLEAHDKKRLFAHVAEDSDARKICGFPSMYTVLDVLDRLNIKYRAETFAYQQAVNYETGCGVTFAGMGFYRLPSE